MYPTQAIVLLDHLGRRLRGRLLGNGHILLSQHAHRYTYGRLSRRGLVELYDDEGGFIHAEILEFEEEHARMPAVAFARAA